MRDTGRIRTLAGALGCYTAVSLLLFGRNVVRDLTDRVVGDDAADKTLYMWSLEWWPHAVAAAHNPLDVDVAWAPHGFDLGFGTAGGGLALAAWPLTEALGAVATYNLLTLAAPALAATTAFLLAHRVTQRFLPALVGGYVFGFSSYELGRILGHLPLAFIVLIPLVPYLVLRRHEKELSCRAFVSLLAGVLVAQFLIVPQVLFTLVVLGALAAAVALRSPRWRRIVLEAGVALFVAVVLISPFVSYAVASDATAPARSPFSGAADLLNYVVPTQRTWLRPPGASNISDRFTGAASEQSAYLGLPFLVLIGLAALKGPSQPGRRLLVFVFVAALLVSLGTRVKIAGEVVAVGPWSAIAPLPVLGSALPARLTLYTALFGGVLVALALADRRSIARWSLAAAGVLVTLPNFGLDSWSSDVPRPLFFTRNAHERVVPKDSTALILPYGPAGWSMLWHAETGFRFRMIGGHFGLRVTPDERAWRDVYEALGRGQLSPGRLRSFLTGHGVDVVVVAPGTRVAVRRLVHTAAGSPPRRVLDALVYHLRPSS